MSSEASAAVAPRERCRVSTYSFQQLEAPVGGAGSASELLSSAWIEAEQIRERAREAGEAEGRAAGLAAARTEVDSSIAALAAALGEVAELREQLISQLEHDAAEMALGLSEQVLAGALAVQPERVIDVARNALRRVTDRHRVILVVNPADLEILSESVQTLQSELGGIETCDVQSDRRVGRGGVILRTEAGEIDARVEAGMERAREIVAEVLKGEPDDA
jgi:flagellar assembly protein FliH